MLDHVNGTIHMQARHFVLAMLAAAFAFGAVSAAAVAQSRQDPASVSAKQQAKKSTTRATPVGTKIACPKGGCRLIPANCKVTMEENWDGGPTGNELIDCP